MAIKEKGEQIENFSLVDQNGDQVNLADLNGNIMLSFHPLAFTSVCLDQMRDLENAYDALKEKGVTAFGVSVDPAPAKSAWAKFACLEKLSILSDFSPFAKVTKDCGIFHEDMNTSGRANIIVNNKGEVLYSKEYELGERPDLDEIFDAIENL